jgi:SAM-dependent methyltransferase
MRPADTELLAHYAQGLERNRLDDLKGALEFERTKEILLRRLPDPPAEVADVGGGPGRYALWLAELGYQVQHRDLVPLHVEQLREAHGHGVHTQVGDACDLDLADACVDAVLLLGPLYHLRERPERLQVLREARRILRPGGPVFAAAISRWAPRLSGVVFERLHERQPEILALLPNIERTGVLPAVTPNGFSGYVHRPHELAIEVTESGLELEQLTGVEGMPLASVDIQARLEDPLGWQVLLEAARAVEHTPELLGLSPHLIATAHRPADDLCR